MKIVADNIISGNVAEKGGGLFLQLVRPTLTRNSILGNTAQADGGGDICK